MTNKNGFDTPRHCSLPLKNEIIGTFWGYISFTPTFGQFCGKKWEFVALLFFFRSNYSPLVAIFFSIIKYFLNVSQLKKPDLKIMIIIEVTIFFVFELRIGCSFVFYMDNARLAATLSMKIFFFYWGSSEKTQTLKL